jgi:hypothetical protein
MSNKTLISDQCAGQYVDADYKKIRNVLRQECAIVGPRERISGPVTPVTTSVHC